MLLWTSLDIRFLEVVGLLQDYFTVLCRKPTRRRTLSFGTDGMHRRRYATSTACGAQRGGANRSTPTHRDTLRVLCRKHAGRVLGVLQEQARVAVLLIVLLDRLVHLRSRPKVGRVHLPQVRVAGGLCRHVFLEGRRDATTILMICKKIMARWLPNLWGC